MREETRLEKQAATARLKEILEERHLSQRDFARLIGKQESEVSRWFSGKFSISASTREKIEKVLGQPLSGSASGDGRGGVTRIGITGTGSIASRFASEAGYVDDVKVCAVYNPDINQAEAFAARHGIRKVCGSFGELLGECDAVYIASPLETHSEYSVKALDSGRHVLCEMPLAAGRKEIDELYRKAAKAGLTFLPALKTAYCPSFIQMTGIAQSGIIGSIVDISATVTNLLPSSAAEAFANERMMENLTYPLLTAFRIFGTRCRESFIFNRWEGGKLQFTHAGLEYPEAIATFKVGVGVKSEGSLIVSGTRGYIYVPAPWWKTDYFEVRFENPADNKKYFFPYESDGLRYEIRALRDIIGHKASPDRYISREESLRMADIQTKIMNHR